ncbi:alpha glucoside transporter [Microdochium trichocladiopsis]|uniref:Alpha glucoside transporter n=1 Tax=Microdochium trichocladiopsis TaxID=1682393 RepID=A0A9P8YCN2_9PEZI|nr:alpha glucoside transporter [Microdochium trichocladiopsis]KAH7033653.1 alpha glucoside transporter [Microdochium trichocladiopsis]
MAAHPEPDNKQDGPVAQQHEDVPNNILAQSADQEEHVLGAWASLMAYPWASAWCVYACWCVTLLGFDAQAAGAIVGIPQFRKDFGYEFEGEYVLPAYWQSLFNAAPVAAATFASLASAELSDRIGRKWVLAIALAFSYIAVAVEMVATTNEVFFAGKFINGFMIGIIGTIMIGYIGEIAPLALRGVFTVGVGVAYGIGPLLAFIVINYTGTADNAWAYRTVFATQFGFAGVATLLWPFMPESPWWLARKNRRDATIKALGRLGYTGDEGIKKLALIEKTLDEVRAETEGTTYMECFRGSNLRRTLISIMPLIIQIFSGITFVAGYFTYYLQLAGYDTQTSYRLQIAQPVLSIVGNLMAASAIERVGRRNMTFYGLIILTIFLFITGGLGTRTEKPMVEGTVAFILIYSWWYNVSIGSTAFSLLAETSTSRLRVKTVAIGYSLQSAFNVMWQFVIPYMFNPDKANLGAKMAFIFGGICFFFIGYLFYFQPETAGRSYQELDEMFAKGVPSRKFKTYKTSMQMQAEEEPKKGEI